jgi:hypothetical protein
MKDNVALITDALPAPAKRPRLGEGLILGLSSDARQQISPSSKR